MIKCFQKILKHIVAIEAAQYENEAKTLTTFPAAPKLQMFLFGLQDYVFSVTIVNDYILYIDLLHVLTDPRVTN